MTTGAATGAVATGAAAGTGATDGDAGAVATATAVGEAGAGRQGEKATGEGKDVGLTAWC